MVSKNKKGFTIIELVVVLAIIGILILLAMPRFMGHIKKSRITLIRHDIKVIENKIAERYIDGNLIFQEWDKVSKDLKELVSQGKLYETAGLAKEVETAEYRIIPIEIKKEGGTKLKGSFYVNKNGKVYYEDTKGSKIISSNNCPIMDCGSIVPIKDLSSSEEELLDEFASEADILHLYEYEGNKILFMFTLKAGKISPEDSIGMDIVSKEIVYGVSYDSFINEVPFPTCYTPITFNLVNIIEKPTMVISDNSEYIKPQLLREEMKALIGYELPGDFSNYTLYNYDGKEYIIGFQFFENEDFGATVYNFTDNISIYDIWYSWHDWGDNLPFPTHFLSEVYEVAREECPKKLDVCGLLFDDNLAFEKVEKYNIIKDVNGNRWLIDSLIDMHFILNKEKYDKLNAYDYIEVVYYDYDKYFIGLKEDGTLWKYNPVEGENKNDKLLLSNVKEFHKVEDGIIALLKNGDLYGWGNARYTGLGNNVGYADTPTKVTSDVDYLILRETLYNENSQLLIIKNDGTTHIIGGFSRVSIPYHLSNSRAVILGVESFKLGNTPPRTYNVMLEEDGKLLAIDWLYNYNSPSSSEIISSDVIDYFEGTAFLSTGTFENPLIPSGEWQEWVTFKSQGNIKKTFRDNRYTDGIKHPGYALTNDNKLYDFYENHIMDNVKDVEILLGKVAKITTLNNEEYLIDEEYNISSFKVENMSKKIISLKYSTKEMLIYNIDSQIFIKGHSTNNYINFPHGEIIDVNLVNSYFGQIAVTNNKGELWYLNLEEINSWHKVGTKNECLIYDLIEGGPS